jgi:hypothetical protein
LADAVGCFSREQQSMPFPFPNDLSTATTVREGGNVFINAGRKKKKIVCKPRLSAFLSLMNDPLMKSIWGMVGNI